MANNADSDQTSFDGAAEEQSEQVLACLQMHIGLNTNFFSVM